MPTAISSLTPWLTHVEGTDTATLLRDGSAGARRPLSRDVCLSHAVLGLGRFGSIHARKLAGLAGFRLCAVMDASSAAQASADHAALPLLTDVDQLPDDIDSATVATPDASHAGLALALLQRGCHVLVEKPLCLAPADGALLLRAAHDHGATLCTGHIERFNPLWTPALRESLHTTARTYLQRDEVVLRFQRSSSRSALAIDSVFDLMVHDLDLLAWLCAVPTGAPLQVVERRVGAHGIRVRVRLGGVLAELESGYADAPASARLWVRQGEAWQLLDLRDRARSLPACDDALTRQYRAFHDAVRGKPGLIASGADGLAAVVRAHQVVHG